jgi:hypothetical protein
MGHWLQGLVGRVGIRNAARTVAADFLYCDLKQDFGLVFEPAFDTELADREPGRFAAYGREISRSVPCAYIVTTYHGGTGGQAAQVWSDGNAVMHFMHGPGPNGPISEALRSLGVRRLDTEIDEFDSLGLNYCRHNEQIAEVLRGGRDYYRLLENLQQQSRNVLN